MVNSKLEGVEAKLEKLEAKLERTNTQVDKRLNDLEMKVDKRLNDLEMKVDKLESKFDTRFDTLEAKLTTLIESQKRRDLVTVGSSVLLSILATSFLQVSVKKVVSVCFPRWCMRIVCKSQTCIDFYVCLCIKLS